MYMQGYILCVCNLTLYNVESCSDGHVTDGFLVSDLINLICYLQAHGFD